MRGRAEIHGMAAVAVAVAVAVELAACTPSVSAQVPGIWWTSGDSAAVGLRVVNHEGYAALPLTELGRLGWRIAPRGDTVDLLAPPPSHDTVRLVIGTPYIRWADDVLQLTHPPYWLEGSYFVPAQLLVDFLPRRSAGVTYDPLTRTLTTTRQRASLATDEGRLPETPASARRDRPVVVIDPGHGGRDPGTTGGNGVREKDVALALGRALARELSADSSLEVRLTRESDVLIPLWRRGEQATRWKGDRPGVFISLHANALPGSHATRGFETYILSEARTDHERRVAAIENGTPLVERRATVPEEEELDHILRELQNLGYQTWSVFLAELVQEELGTVHTGRDRGVQQAPLAVITNALMPAVLVEAGYLTNPADEALLRSPIFHRDAARAIARAVRRFFERYPPGSRGT